MRRARPLPTALPGLAALTLPALALMAAAGAPAAAQDDGIALGAVVEPFEIEDLDGTVVNLAEVIGTKPVLAVFWATWCPVCRVLDPTLAAAHERFGDRVEFLVVAVGVGQQKAQIAQHLTRHPVAGRLLWDERGVATRAFEAPGTGYVVLLDAEGTVRWTGTGPEQDIEAAIRSVLR